MSTLNLKVDFTFKKFFGSQENKSILMEFINSIISDKNKIINIELKNPYSISNYIKGKMEILYIKAIDEKGIGYNIEMQIAKQGSYDKSAFYYWSKVYSEQIKSEEDFNLFRKTIGINIVDFNYSKEEKFHNVYKIYNEETKEEFSDLLELHFIELKKFNKSYKYIETSLERWVTFLNKSYKINKDKIPKELAKDENIIKAIKRLNTMKLNKKEIGLYEKGLKMLTDSKIKTKTVNQKNVKEKQENLLNILDDKTIAIKTELTPEEVKELRY